MSIKVLVDDVVVYEEIDRMRKIMDKLDSMNLPEDQSNDLTALIKKLDEATKKVEHAVETLNLRATAHADTSTISPSAAEAAKLASQVPHTPAGAQKA
jgi:hypothetical protein